MFWISMALLAAQPGAYDAAMEAAEAVGDATEAPEAPTEIDDVELTMRAWQDCTIREAKPMAGRTAELADTVATAAMTFCLNEEQQIIAASRVYLEEQYDNPDNAPEIVGIYKGMWRKRLVAAIIKWRSQQN